MTVNKGERLGVNAPIRPGRTLGEDERVGAGAVVTTDVPDGKIVVGMPAKVFRDVPAEQRLENQGWKDE